jgi:hypothetical protein
LPKKKIDGQQENGADAQACRATLQLILARSNVFFQNTGEWISPVLSDPARREMAEGDFVDGLRVFFHLIPSFVDLAGEYNKAGVSQSEYPVIFFKGKEKRLF